MKRIIPFIILFCGFFILLVGQKPEMRMVSDLVRKCKEDVRGPYRDIRWFCTDGSYAMPREKCPEPGGVQRARYKEEVVALGESSHIFLGQILSRTPVASFWDADNYNSRLKQYQLEKYLRSIDDGWILQKGQYYRGAYQIEDEESWGIDFFSWLLADDKNIQKQFYLIRQAAKDIPHKGDDSKTLNVRALSKVISDSYPAFMDLRVKIHGQPDATDIPRVQSFLLDHKARLSDDQKKKFETLIADMKSIYQASNVAQLSRFTDRLPREMPIVSSLLAYIKHLDKEERPSARAIATAELLSELRLSMMQLKKGKSRLDLIDLSNSLEEIFLVEIGKWKPKTVRDCCDKICYSGMSAFGTGLIEQWEWDELINTISISGQTSMTTGELFTFFASARSLVEWGTGMVNGVYKEVVSLYSGFEPKANGFYDDRIRSSVLLSTGDAVGMLGVYLAQQSELTNKVMNIPNQSTIRGINPGLAFGELAVVEGHDSDLEVSNDKIYIFLHPPSDLKPVAGIMTVTEGNMVSHVQLLARNLGIPNAVISTRNVEDLKSFAGKKVFYAVSGKGTVIMKTTENMTEEEKQLFAVKARKEERISVPIEKMDLGNRKVLNMREISAAASGRICGPKAANLGQLKSIFPDNVVEGLVLPFGLFRMHMDQQMPTGKLTYWEYLRSVFERAQNMRAQGISEEDVEAFTMKELAALREAIKSMKLLPSFVSDLEKRFSDVFGNDLGKIPVFLRSDTNMEDLKDFTGAGLNLTLFNVVEKEKVLQGIKDVWASPYTERSFRWRQRYLLNPENVFPSILIIPSVDVEYSGVLITKGIPTGDDRDRTIAFSRGAGGAVDGQAAESYLQHHSGEYRLLAPAREPAYRRLPASGGSQMIYTTFESRILNEQNLADLRWLAGLIDGQLDASREFGSEGPFDVELGFLHDKMWLFQIRPFVENKNAVTSEFLERISPKINENKIISLSGNL